jgi:quercetin dioxygenase-like cupin family protein
MKRHKLDDMVRGWFVGDFTPSLYATQAVEVAVQRYPAGTVEAEHLHRIATEITVIVSGEAEMQGQHLVAGDIVVLEPGEITGFRALTDVVTTVVKLPGAKNDKYLV